MNQTGNAGIIIPWDGITPSKYYTLVGGFWLRGIQSAGSGVVQDKSGNGADASLNGISDANCWANAGYFSSLNGGAVAKQGPTVSAAKIPWDMSAGHSLILAMNVSLNAGGASAGGVFGTQSSGLEKGFRFQLSAVNTPAFSVADGTTQGLSSAAVTAAFDGTERHICVTVDGVTKTARMYVNGALEVTKDVSSVTGTTIPTNGFSFGHINSTATSNPPWTGKYTDAHCLIIPSGGLPATIGMIINKLYKRRFTPLTDADFGL